MSTEFRDKLVTKCLKIYERERSLKPIDKFLCRLNLQGSLQGEIWEESIVPEIRKLYFPDMTLDSLLDKMVALYGSYTRPVSALLDIWAIIDWKIPFVGDEFSEFVERFETLLKNVPNPPTREDWDDLNEFLGK